jgi:hypothetical protein
MKTFGTAWSEGISAGDEVRHHPSHKRSALMAAILDLESLHIQVDHPTDP